MSTGLPGSLRRLVAERANFRCEYCLVYEVDSFLPFQVDHIVSQKHGGSDEPENLAYACPHCNQHKGTDLTTFLDTYEDIVSLFHPKLHDWWEHFEMNDGEIIAKTRRALATIKVLKLNQAERLMHRQILAEIGHYP